MCSLERESVQLIVHRLWTIGRPTSCCVQDSDRWCNKQHCITTTEPLFASLFPVTCFRSNFCLSRYRISNLHVGECVYDSKSSSQISSWSWIKKAYSVGYFVNCWPVALVNAKRLRRSLTVLQTRNTFCDVPSNADLSIACTAEQLFV